MNRPDMVTRVTEAVRAGEIRRVVATLRFTRPARLHFHHAGPLYGLLCSALQIHPLPRRVLPFACEAAHVSYAVGDLYRLGLTILGEGMQSGDPVSQLADGLTRIGRSAWGQAGPPPTLYGNFELENIGVFPRETGLEKTRDGTGDSEIARLRFVSPLRLERPFAQQRRGSTYMDAGCFPGDHFLIRLWSRLYWLVNGVKATPDMRDLVARTLPAETRTASTRLWWIDVPIRGNGGDQRDQPTGYTLGGVLGEVELEGVDEVWRDLLTVGQWVHAGGKVQFGFGRYVVEQTWDPGLDPFAPARPYREQLSDPGELEVALAHVAQHSECAGVDRLHPADVGSDDPEIVSRLSQEIRVGRYRARRLMGIVQTKRDGKPRALVVPTVADRCAQRAAVQVLGAAVDILLEDCSFAYRKGFSRTHAAQAINRAYEQGYRYVLDADISAFFDSVPWDVILAKVRALFPYEGISGLIASWLRAPVEYGGRTIARDRGLPQGAAISPLLANLLLDEFDEELLDRNYRLVRYADDFVVLCRDLDEARKARDDAGFSYLGYLFLRSLVLEQKSPKPETGRPLRVGDVPLGSWLAHVPLERIQGLRKAPDCEEGTELPRLVSLASDTSPPA